VLQNVILVDCNDKLPVSSQRQRSAFPPNFVHSLDSTHMLLTAIELKVSCTVSFSPKGGEGKASVAVVLFT